MAQNRIFPHAVILTALPVEFRAVYAHLSHIHEKTLDVGTVYWQGTFPCKGYAWRVSLIETGPNNAVAAIETERAISSFQPDVALFVGVAGGLKDVKKGDIVAADKIYNYESGKDDIKFLPRPEAGHATYRMEHRAKAVRNNKLWLRRIKGPITTPPPEAYVGAIAAGEKVVSSVRSTTYKRLKQQYSNALALEMEGYGFLRAIYAHQQVNALVIRGISDLIEDKNETNDKDFQDLASRYASAFAFEVLAQLGADEKFLATLKEREPQKNASLTQKPANTYSINNSGQMVVGNKAQLNNYEIQPPE